MATTEATQSHCRSNGGSLESRGSPARHIAELQRLPARVIAEAMGASVSHGSKVRSGRLVPHKRHWKALFKVIGTAD
jgi:hypothetical protein